MKRIIFILLFVLFLLNDAFSQDCKQLKNNEIKTLQGYKDKDYNDRISRINNANVLLIVNSDVVGWGKDYWVIVNGYDDVTQCSTWIRNNTKNGVITKTGKTEGWTVDFREVGGGTVTSKGGQWTQNSYFKCIQCGTGNSSDGNASSAASAGESIIDNATKSAQDFVTEQGAAYEDVKNSNELENRARQSMGDFEVPSSGLPAWSIQKKEDKEIGVDEEKN